MVDNRDPEVRDRHEYAFMKAMLAINKRLSDANQPLLGLSRMIELRNAWNLDFGQVGFTLSDWDRLGQLLPEGDIFDDVRLEFKSKDLMMEFLAESSREYKTFVDNNLYPVAITDPDLQKSGVVFDIRKPFLTTRDGPLRTLDVRTGVSFLDRKGLLVKQVSAEDMQLYTNIVLGIDNFDIGQDVNESKFFGWHGRTSETFGEQPGLKTVLGAYLTKADAKMAEKLFTDKEYDWNTAYDSAEILKHLRSNGLDFSVSEFTSKNDQLEVVLKDRARTKIRIFDENPAYLGRVYDSYNSYYYTIAAAKGSEAYNNVTWSVQDALAIIDYVTGQKKGAIRHYAKGTSAVSLEGVDPLKKLHVRPVDKRFDSVIFESEQDAAVFLEQVIDDAGIFYDDEFDLDSFVTRIKQGVMDGTIESMDFEDLYSMHDSVRDVQELFVTDLIMLEDARQHGYLDSLEGVELLSVNQQVDVYTDDYIERLYEALREEQVGSYESGFDPGVIVEFAGDQERRNVRDAVMSALKISNYDLNKLRGNSFSTNAIKDNLVKFNANTAVSLDDITHPMMRKVLERVQSNLKDGGFRGVDNAKDPFVAVDDQGIIQWQAERFVGIDRKTKEQKWQAISGEIGQIFVPDERGVIHTKFGSGSDYAMIPGGQGYFSFEGLSENRMERFRVRGFEQIMNEELDMLIRKQMLRPYDEKLDNIVDVLDSSALNGLYHGDVYGKRISDEFLNSSNLQPDVVDAIIKTYKGRVRFDNQYGDYATTMAETQASDYKSDSEFSYWKAAGEQNMRVLAEDTVNYIDQVMTGTGKTQGLIWYLTEGAVVNEDGSVTPSEGMWNEKGELEPDKAPLRKLDYFDYDKFNAWDRNQMASNQLLTALSVDESCGVALMTFGGWTFDDSYAVSKDFADRNYVPGVVTDFSDVSDIEAKAVRENDLQGVLERLTMDELEQYIAQFEASDSVTERNFAATHNLSIPYRDKDIYPVLDAYLDLKRSATDEAKVIYNQKMDTFGQLRPLKRGDKISDFGGNKGTIGIVIDRHMDLDVAKNLKLDHEVAIMKANPDLDVVGAPYSMMSRFNAGVPRELMAGEVKDIVDPVTGEVFTGALGRSNIIVTDLLVDEKTHAYSEIDVAEGKGRKASGQLAWALNSKDAKGMLSEIYGDNVRPWTDLREYLIATGLDMSADGTLLKGYHPHNGELRREFDYDKDKSAVDFLRDIKDSGGFLKLPFEVNFETGEKTTSIPVLSASLRRDTELIDGKMRRSDYTNHYINIYQALGDYYKADSALVNEKQENGKYLRVPASEEKKQEYRDKAMSVVQSSFTKIQKEIIDRQLNGTANGKHSFIRDKIMGKRMDASATAVAIVDPRLNIGEAAVNGEILSALKSKEHDVIAAHRDPVLRDGALRSLKLKYDATVHGVAINPIADKSHDMDFDGDTMGLMKYRSREALQDLTNKFGHVNNMIDLGGGKNELYFQSGMDLASAEAKALKLGDSSLIELKEQAQRDALSNDERVRRSALNALNDYSHKAFREYGFGSAYIDLTNETSMMKSFEEIVETGAKGSPSKLERYQRYFEGQKTVKDDQDTQYATGIKADGTGVAGSFSQRLVSALRNDNVTAALESTYLITHGNLQAKHDPDEARMINSVMTNELRNLYNGRSSDGRSDCVTKNQFVSEMSTVLGEQLGLSFNEDYIKEMADGLSDSKGIIQPVSEVVASKGSAMDLVAYGGGYKALQQLAHEKRSLLEGQQSQLFAPKKMREATDETSLMKQDVLNHELIDAIKVSVQEQIQPVVDDLTNKQAVEVHEAVEMMQLDDDLDFA